MCVLDRDLTPESSLDSLQPKHIWTGWRQEKCHFSPLKFDGMHHPCISKGELWIWMSNWLSPSAFYFEWSCRHLTPSLSVTQSSFWHSLGFLWWNALRCVDSGLNALSVWRSTASSQHCLGAPRAVPVVEEAQVGQQPLHAGNSNKKASLDKGAAAGSFPALQNNAGNSPLSHSEEREGVFFGMDCVWFFSDILSTCDFPS